MYDKSYLLIVDDQKLECEMLEKLLTHQDYCLTFANCGKEALKAAEECVPDLILLDVVMPDIDGFEVCTQLRAHPKLAEVPIIMITAVNDHGARLHGIEVGADDFITKPFDENELRSRVRSITRLNRYRRLLAERSRFEWAVEQSNDSYLLLAGGDLIQYANSSARFYLGILNERTLPASFSKLIEQQKYRREPEIAWSDWPEPNLGSLPRYLVRPESAHSPSIWLQADLLELPSEKLGNQLLHLRDVSEHLNLQQQMWSFQSLVSHKLRVPLNGLVSLQMLDEKIVDLSGPRAKILLQIARESAKRLQDQILDVLRYVDSSQLPLQSHNIFDLSQLASLLEQVRKEVDIKDVKLHIAHGLMKQCLAFSTQSIELMLRELLTNAKKFHPQQSPAIEVSVTPIDEFTLLFSVTDDGCWLEDKKINCVWIPYYQLERYFTGEVQGMGLGLAMIAKLVWSQGGSGRLVNREDRPGIRVELTLPLKET